MTGSARCIALLLALGAAASAHAGRPAYPFELTNDREGDHYVVMLHNRGPVPVTVTVDMAGTNVRGDRVWPGTFVVPPGTSVAAGRVYSVDHTKASQYDTRGDFELGDMAAMPDPAALYRLPFADGLAFPVAQSVRGLQRTHTTPDSRYAVDFTMPEGTPVVAARAGTVAEILQGNTVGGPDPQLIDRANAVVVLHADGTMALYAHLAAGPPPVAVGQAITAGTLLGRSGNTGYSFGPHLHFAVQRTMLVQGRAQRVSIPIRFYVGSPPAPLVAREGSVLLANYGAPTPAPGTALATRRPGSWAIGGMVVCFVAALACLLLWWRGRTTGSTRRKRRGGLQRTASPEDNWYRPKEFRRDRR